MTSCHTVVLVICFRFLLYDFFFSTSSNVIIVVISLTLLVILVPYAISFIYYGKILIYARRLARQEAAERRHFDGSVVLDNNIGPQEVGHSHLFRISFFIFVWTVYFCRSEGFFSIFSTYSFLGLSGIF